MIDPDHPAARGRAARVIAAAIAVRVALPGAGPRLAAAVDDYLAGRNDIERDRDRFLMRYPDPTDLQRAVTPSAPPCDPDPDKGTPGPAQARSGPLRPSPGGTGGTP
jgi:hypothetical protein